MPERGDGRPKSRNSTDCDAMIRDMGLHGATSRDEWSVGPERRSRGGGAPGYTAMVIPDGVISGEGWIRINSHSYLSHLRFKLDKKTRTLVSKEPRYLIF